ncbi:MAG: hypothetical protein ACJ780_24570 [Solirubrobacteraceae bacterium]
MPTPYTSSRVLLVARVRSDGTGVGQVPVRRFRLARVRVSPSVATVAAPHASAKGG